jgi:hypothetical protein
MGPSLLNVLHIDSPVMEAPLSAHVLLCSFRKKHPQTVMIQRDLGVGKSEESKGVSRVRGYLLTLP